MQHAVEKITTELAKEVQCYRELLEVVQAERDILLHGDHKQLMGTAEQKLGLTERLAAAQENRREAMVAVSGTPDTPAKLIDLTPYLPQESRAGFRSTVREAARLAKRLSQLNEGNKGFLEEALDTVDHLLSIITGQNKASTYDCRGMTRGGAGRSLVVKEV